MGQDKSEIVLHRNEAVSIVALVLLQLVMTYATKYMVYIKLNYKTYV